jgi:hypothetical protein
MMEHMTPPDQLVGGDDAVDTGFDKGRHQQQLHQGGVGDSFMAFDSLDKIQVDFDMSDLAVMEGMLDGNIDDLNKFLAKEAAVGDINNEGHNDIVNGLNLDQLNLELYENLSHDDEISESSMDKLLRMNIIEVDDFEKKQQQQQHSTGDYNSELMQEFAKGFLAPRENTIVQQHRFSDGNDPILGRFCANADQIHYEQKGVEQMQIQHQQQQMMMMMDQQQEENDLKQQIQTIQMQAMMQQKGSFEEEQDALTSAKVSQLASMGSEELEREKLKLLNRLKEINFRQMNSINTMQPQVHSQQASFSENGGPSSGVFSAVGNCGSSGGGNGETPLSAFLRNKNKGGGAVPSHASIMSQENPAAHDAASILDIAPMDFVGSSNPFLCQAAAGGSPLVGSTINSSLSQSTIRKSLSGRNLRATGVSLNRQSGQSVMDMMSSDLGRGSNRNASWGSSGIANLRRTEVSSFSSSGILQRRVSDGSLLTGATTVSASLAKTKNRVGSLSRENSLYNMLKNKQGPHKPLNSMARQSSYSRLSKSGSRGNLSKNDSFGSLLPTKRGGGRMGPKYKIGASTSVPQLMARESPNPIGHGGNALW